MIVEFPKDKAAQAIKARLDTARAVVWRMGADAAHCREVEQATTPKQADAAVYATLRDMIRAKDSALRIAEGLPWLNERQARLLIADGTVTLKGLAADLLDMVERLDYRSAAREDVEDLLAALLGYKRPHEETIGRELAATANFVRKEAEAQLSRLPSVEALVANHRRYLSLGIVALAAFAFLLAILLGKVRGAEAEAVRHFSKTDVVAEAQTAALLYGRAFSLADELPRLAYADDALVKAACGKLYDATGRPQTPLDNLGCFIPDGAPTIWLPATSSTDRYARSVLVRELVRFYQWSDARRDGGFRIDLPGRLCQAYAAQWAVLNWSSLPPFCTDLGRR